MHQTHVFRALYPSAALNACASPSSCSLARTSSIVSLALYTLSLMLLTPVVPSSLLFSTPSPSPPTPSLALLSFPHKLPLSLLFYSHMLPPSLVVVSLLLQHLLPTPSLSQILSYATPLSRCVIVHTAALVCSLVSVDICRSLSLSLFGSHSLKNASSSC